MADIKQNTADSMLKALQPLLCLNPEYQRGIQGVIVEYALLTKPTKLISGILQGENKDDTENVHRRQRQHQYQIDLSVQSWYSL